MTEDLILTSSVGDTRVISMNRPHRRNALSFELLKQLKFAIAEAAESDATGIMLEARGPVFCSGHDFADVRSADVETVRLLIDSCVELMKLIQLIPLPVLAKVHGLATAAGCQLVAACDLAVATENAEFAAPGGKGGWFCHTPMVEVARCIGRKRALEMALTGDSVSAETALAWGLVNRVVPTEELDHTATELLARATRGSRVSKGLGKRTLYAHLAMSTADAYELTSKVMVESSQSRDAQEGFSAFLDKRRPVWSS